MNFFALLVIGMMVNSLPHQSSNASFDSNVALEKRQGAITQGSAIVAGGLIGAAFGPPGAILGALGTAFAVVQSQLQPSGIYDSIKGLIQAQIDESITRELNENNRLILETQVRTVQNRIVDAVRNLQRDSSDYIDELQALEDKITENKGLWFVQSDTFTYDEFILCTPTGIGDKHLPACLHLERNQEQQTQNLVVDTNGLSVTTLTAMTFTQRNGFLEYVKRDGSGRMCVGFDQNGDDWTRRFLSIRTDTCRIKFTISRDDASFFFHAKDFSPIRAVCVGNGGKKALVCPSGLTRAWSNNDCEGQGDRLESTAFRFMIPAVRSKESSVIMNYAKIGQMLRYMSIFGQLHLHVRKLKLLNGKTDGEVRDFLNLVAEYRRTINALLPIYKLYVKYQFVAKGKFMDNSVDEMEAFQDALNDAKKVTLYIGDDDKWRMKQLGMNVLNSKIFSPSYQ